MRIKLFLPSCLINHVNTSLYYISTYFLHFIILHWPSNMFVLSQFPLIYHISFDLWFLFLVSYRILLYHNLSYKGRMNWQFKASLFLHILHLPLKCFHFFQCSDSSCTDPLCKLAWLYPQWVTEIHLPMTDGYICTKHLLACVQRTVLWP